MQKSRALLSLFIFIEVVGGLGAMLSLASDTFGLAPLLVLVALHIVAAGVGYALTASQEAKLAAIANADDGLIGQGEVQDRPASASTVVVMRTVRSDETLFVAFEVADGGVTTDLFEHDNHRTVVETARRLAADRRCKLVDISHGEAVSLPVTSISTSRRQVSVRSGSALRA